MKTPSDCLDEAGRHLVLASLNCLNWATSSLVLVLGAQPKPVPHVEDGANASLLEQEESATGADGAVANLGGDGKGPGWDPVARAIAEEQAALAQALTPWLRAWPSLLQAQALGNLPSSEALWPLWRLGMEAYLKRSGLRFEGQVDTAIDWDPLFHEGEGMEGKKVRVLTPALLLGDRVLWRAAVGLESEASTKKRD